MKNMSFGNLMAIFGGVFVAVIVVTVLLIKMVGGASSSKQVVINKRPPAQTQQQQAQSDVLSLQLAAAQREAQVANEARKASDAQTQAMREEMQRNSRLLMQQLSAVSSSVNTLEQRLATMESNRGRVEVIKPPRKTPKPVAESTPPQNVVKLPASIGYKVQATVGNRAWVRAGNNEDSVRAGDRLPPVQPELRVKAVDADSGIVITTSAR